MRVQALLLAKRRVLSVSTTSSPVSALAILQPMVRKCSVCRVTILLQKIHT
uniref:Uncharacterized protein n=1 Tax=Brassica campestris TaxID=3711 RepID=A0A3P5YIL9_BRACM|nr:unnamed protein product [Brassica rapa]